uniref:Uncharacterized protein n=1 Tax=Arundo donax TaxID=35708 RepID=A0A0A9GGP9_ARUDO
MVPSPGSDLSLGGTLLAVAWRIGSKNLPATSGGCSKDSSPGRTRSPSLRSMDGSW